MANKAFLKRWSLRRSDGSFPGPPPTGGCCKNDGTCEILTEEECNALAGSAYKGDDVLCADAGCDPAGACCTGTDCNQYTNAYCTELSGVYHGDAVGCDSLDCPDSNVCITTGSCCHYNTSTGQYGCLDCMTEQECTDLSDDTTTTLCDIVWKEGVDCSSASCNDIGRCCYHVSGWESGCENITESECTALNGHWDSDKACDDCELGGVSENCPTGRCCVAADDGSFSVCQENVTQVTCEVWGDTDGYASEWVDGGNCDEPNPCGFGVCCDGGNCVGPVLSSQCPSGFDSSMTECIEDCDQCELISCCITDGCVAVTECDCEDAGGVPSESGTEFPCFPNPCEPPIPTGACCCQNSCTDDMTEDDCLASSNCSWMGLDSTCDGSCTVNCCTQAGSPCVSLYGTECSHEDVWDCTHDDDGNCLNDPGDGGSGGV